MKFDELTDEQWEFIEPLLPPKASTGRRGANDRMIINGIVYVLRTGVSGRKCRKNLVLAQLVTQDSRNELS